MDPDENEPVALHVLVVGFHHKKGMQVEHAYPPLSKEEGAGCDLPEKWKFLPSLCLPDGAHNHEADTIYFHLPHLTKETQTVFGVSCYRQIDAEKVANKTADITRNTVQKSVCVITTLPIYGYVQERLKVTTKVYFKGADFSDVRDLEGLYHDLNNTNWRDRLMHGICVSDAVRIFGRNILVLFKLLLLERKVLFYNSPVSLLVKVITSLLALLPANLPEGLAQAAATRYTGSPHLSSAHIKRVPKVSANETELLIGQPQSNECPVEEYKPPKDCQGEQSPRIQPDLHPTFQMSPSDTLGEVKEELSKIINITSGDDATEGVSTDGTPSQERLSLEGIPSESDELSERRSSLSSLTSVTSRGSIMSPPNSLQGTPSEQTPNLSSKISSLKGRLSGAINYWTGKDPKPPADRPSSTVTPNPSPSEPGDDTPLSPTSGLPMSPAEHPNDLTHASPPNQPICTEKYALLESTQCGLPLQIFTKGNLLHPYLSLQYLDALTAPSTRAFVVGASNTLFIHKRDLYEVLVQMDEGKIEVHDADLRRQLSLSTEDLRFGDNLVRQVDAVNLSLRKNPIDDFAPSSPPDVFLEGVGWMGGEEWLRHQFKIYLLTMLRASLCPDVSRECEVFNSSFLSAWKETHNYRMWLAGGPYPPLMELTPGHPHAGHLSMTDMRIRLSHTIQGLDRGRRLNQTLANTGTAVVKTKEVVGGALTSAKGALSTLWSSFTTPAQAGRPEDAQDALEAEELAGGPETQNGEEVTDCQGALAPDVPAPGVPTHDAPAPSAPIHGVPSEKIDNGDIQLKNLN